MGGEARGGRASEECGDAGWAGAVGGVGDGDGGDAVDDDATEGDAGIDGRDLSPRSRPLLPFAVPLLLVYDICEESDLRCRDEGLLCGFEGRSVAVV